MASIVLRSVALKELRQNLPALTGIRGVAAVLVLLFHLPLQTSLPLIRNCWLGVDLFFILSGFILMHVHRELQEPTWQRVRSFFVLRFFRVYPLHFAILMLILALVVVFPSFPVWEQKIPGLENAFSVAGFFQTLTLTNRIGLPDLGEWNGPSWSLSSEVLGYIFFPAMVVLVSRVRSRAVCYAFTLCSLTAFCGMMFAGHAGVVRMLLTFPAGVALARAYQIGPIGPTATRYVSAISCAMIIICLSIDRIAPLGAFGFAGLIYALALGGGATERFFSLSPIMFLGKISFSLYLTHHALFMFLAWYGGTTFPWLTLMAATSVGLAVVTYNLIEVPSHQYGRRVAARFLTAKPAYGQ